MGSTPGAWSMACVILHTADEKAKFPLSSIEMQTAVACSRGRLNRHDLSDTHSSE